MSIANPKRLYVYYNADKQPVDIDGNPFSHFGKDFIGGHLSSEIWFSFGGDDLIDITALAVSKRKDGETRYDLLDKKVDDGKTYYVLYINKWYLEVVGDLTIAVKVFKGILDIDGNGEIVDIPLGIEIIVSDIFHLSVAYAPNPTKPVEESEISDIELVLLAISNKPSSQNVVYVATNLPDDLNSGDYDGRFFFINNNGVGRLYYVDSGVAVDGKYYFDNYGTSLTSNDLASAVEELYGLIYALNLNKVSVKPPIGGDAQKTIYTTDGVMGASNAVAQSGYAVLRASGSHVVVPQTPTLDNHATSKYYVDSKVARANLVSVIGEATELLSGLLSASDKETIDVLTAMLKDDDDDDIVNTIAEILEIFENYPEGADIVAVLADKADKDEVPILDVNGLIPEIYLDYVVDGGDFETVVYDDEIDGGAF